MESAEVWVCDEYSASIRFIAGVDGQNLYIWEAVIGLTPLPPVVDNSFSIESDIIYLGQIDINLATKKDLIRLIDNAIQGVIETPRGTIVLAKEKNYSYYSESSHRDRWYYQLHVSISGSSYPTSASYDLIDIDNLLRLSSPPFDGLYDAAGWLGLSTTNLGNNNPSIDMRISPPVDLIFDECKLNDDVFKIVLHAHPLFNTKLLHVALRSAPGDNLKTRLQIASEIEWKRAENNLLLGTASIRVNNSDSIIAILMIGNSVVRRQWFLDPNKARNNRLLAVQSFDRNLKMIRNAVLETTDSSRFENGIAALLFILGFSPCVQIETDSPDLIVQTPNGRLILVECTLKISDFQAKIGKLVDRRGVLIKELEKSGHSSLIASVLVCRLPRDQIAAHADDLRSHNTILITQDQLNDAFDQVRYHSDPDKILEEAESTLSNDSQMSLELKSS